MKKPKSIYAIQTVTNALRLLETFEQGEELGVTELAQRLELHKNNVFRLLATLEEKGYIEQSAQSDRYRLGVACIELGGALSRGSSLIQLARPILVELAETLGESTHLGVMRDFEVVHLDGEQPEKLLLSGSRVGRRLPTHATALGKVLLAFADGEVRERFDATWVAEGRLAAHTANTLVDRDKFFEHLRSVAAEGFAIDSEELEPGLVCVAAPVLDAAGRVIAAISASGPTFRFAEGALHKHLVPAVISAAQMLSERLGAAQ